MPRSGFQIVTTDSVGGQIDSTFISKLKIEFRVTSFTEFTSISISRMDDEQIVGELSTGRIDFTLELPIDANCRIEIVFPRDMPLTQDMEYVNTEGIINSEIMAPTSFTPALNNSFYIDGCDEYMTTISNMVTMVKMKNKGHVMATESFKIYLWTLDSKGTTFPIAKRETGIFFTQ
jgi:hypothetical protein